MAEGVQIKAVVIWEDEVRAAAWALKRLLEAGREEKAGGERSARMEDLWAEVIERVAVAFGGALLENPDEPMLLGNRDRLLAAGKIG